jgi:hypothetical protein
VEVIRDSIDFPSDKGGPQTATKDVEFGVPLASATAVLTGVEFGFSPRNDHHLGNVSFNVTADIIGTTVRVTGTLGVRDWSGDWDDKFEGRLDFAVIAEVM